MNQIKIFRYRMHLHFRGFNYPGLSKKILKISSIHQLIKTQKFLFIFYWFVFACFVYECLIFSLKYMTIKDKLTMFLVSIRTFCLELFEFLDFVEVHGWCHAFWIEALRSECEFIFFESSFFLMDIRIISNCKESESDNSIKNPMDEYQVYVIEAYYMQWLLITRLIYFIYFQKMLEFLDLV